MLVECPICKEPFKKGPPSLNKRYCSVKCANIAKKVPNPSRKTGVIKICDSCSKEFYITKCKIGEKRFCSRKCQYQPGWGFKKNESPMPNNPYKRISIKGKWHKEHRLLMESQIGRKLRRDEHVHHINGNPLDNRIENLTIMSPEEHLRLHKT